MSGCWTVSTRKEYCHHYTAEEDLKEQLYYLVSLVAAVRKTPANIF